MPEIEFFETTCRKLEESWTNATFTTCTIKVSVGLQTPFLFLLQTTSSLDAKHVLLGLNQLKSVCPQMQADFCT